MKTTNCWILHEQARQYYWKGKGQLSIKTFSGGRAHQTEQMPLAMKRRQHRRRITGLFFEGLPHHLPQVAAHASQHYLVDKRVESGRTVSTITFLNDKQRVTELARMLGGQSDAARKHAEALLMKPQNPKPKPQ